MIFAPSHTCYSYNVFLLCAANVTMFSRMYEESKIDLLCESVMIWATTGKMFKNLYFAVRHCCFRVLAASNCCWLPFIRQAEKKLKPHNERLRPHYTWIEHLGLGFRPVLLFIAPVAFTFAIATIIPFPSLVTVDTYAPSDSITILAGYLQVIASVLATLTALLLAVIALTIQVKTSNLAGADFLLNAVIRRRGFLPVAAFLSGTVLTALLGVVLSNRFPLVILNNYTCATVILTLVSFLILFYLLRRTMQTLGASELEQLLSGELLSLLRISFRSTLRQALVERHFSEELADLGFARYTATEKEEGYPTEYKLKRLGKIVAIDPAPLKRISQVLKLTPLPRERNTSNFFVSSPDDAAALVTIQPNGSIMKETQLALLTKERTENKQIAILIQKAFIIRKKPSMEPDWQRLRQFMSSAIVKYESTTLSNVTKALMDSFDDYLEAQAAVAGQGKLLLEDFVGNIVYGFKPPHVSELRLSDLVVEAARTRSQGCLDELLKCIYNLAQTAFNKQNEKYFQDWIFQFYIAYHSFGSYTKDLDFNLAFDITRKVHWLSTTLQMDINRHEKSVERIQKVTPYLIHYLGLCLCMLKVSAERYDQSTFDAVIEHIINFLKYKLRGIKRILDTYHFSDHFTGVPPDLKLGDNTLQEELLLKYVQIYDYKNLVYVITGAWLMHLIKANELKDEKTAPFLEKLIDKTGDFRSLLDLYAMPGMKDITTHHENPLGLDDWDLPTSYYPTTRIGTNFTRWIRPYYQFLLLKKAQICPASIEVNNIRQTEMADHNSLKEFLSQIADDDYIPPTEYQNCPWSIESEEIETAKKQINRVLRSWPNEQVSAGGSH